MRPPTPSNPQRRTVALVLGAAARAAGADWGGYTGVQARDAKSWQSPVASGAWSWHARRRQDRRYATGCTRWGERHAAVARSGVRRASLFRATGLWMPCANSAGRSVSRICQSSSQPSAWTSPREVWLREGDLWEAIANDRPTGLFTPYHCTVANSMGACWRRCESPPTAHGRASPDRVDMQDDQTAAGKPADRPCPGETSPRRSMNGSRVVRSRRARTMPEAAEAATSARSVQRALRARGHMQAQIARCSWPGSAGACNPHPRDAASSTSSGVPRTDRNRPHRGRQGPGRRGLLRRVCPRLVRAMLRLPRRAMPAADGRRRGSQRVRWRHRSLRPARWSLCHERIHCCHPIPFPSRCGSGRSGHRNDPALRRGHWHRCWCCCYRRTWQQRDHRLVAPVAAGDAVMRLVGPAQLRPAGIGTRGAPGARPVARRRALPQARRRSRRARVGVAESRLRPSRPSPGRPSRLPRPRTPPHRRTDRAHVARWCVCRSGGGLALPIGLARARRRRRVAAAAHGAA